MQPKEFHEAANIFPLDEEHLQELADDIATNGLWTPIELYHGLILDGRRRYKACQLAKVEPDYTYVCPPDPVAYVWSLNKHRRHMSTSDLGMAGARMKSMYEKQAKERLKTSTGGSEPRPVIKRSQAEKGKSRDKAGEAVGVSGATIDRAHRVIKKGTPELVEAVDTGKVSVNAASKIAKLPKDEQPDALKAHLESPRKPPEKKATTEADKRDKDHRFTALFARNVADVAIAQLEGIPKRSKHRDEAFVRVEKWIARQRTK